jgi:hypothetical protein
MPGMSPGTSRVKPLRQDASLSIGPRKFVIPWRTLFVLLFVYRCVVTVLAEVFVTAFTELGDATTYQGGVFRAAAFNLEVFANPTKIRDVGTAFTLAIGFVIRSLVGNNAILIDLVFQSIGFFGLYRLLKSVDSGTRKYLYFLFITPSFTIWSSVAGKEAILVCITGIIAAYLVDLFNHRGRVTLLLLASVAVLTIIKPHYLPAILFVFFVGKFVRYFRQKEALTLVAGLVSILFLYLLSDYINDISFQIAPHFYPQNDNSTREIYWVEPYDIFWKAPYGMFQSVYGPTLAEAFGGNPLQFLTFFESAVMLIVLVYFGYRRLPKLPVLSAITVAVGMFWILFLNYPFGIMNPGSAVRYRTGYWLLIVFISVALLSRDLHRRWSEGRPRASFKPILLRKR